MKVDTSMYYYPEGVFRNKVRYRIPELFVGIPKLYRQAVLTGTVKM